ncbi:SemiSWEET family sugar transporter [Polaribacter sp. SA4-12]|uniref:SemiSWEET family sugar transporter n=1 Tax=Polaribacter sp. SA4-12 TaxID=1312072 RepID=UPI0026AE4CD0
MIDFNEIIGLVAAVLTTASFLPQVFKTYKTKDTSGLSLTMYIVFFIGVVLWSVYGIYINSLSIILANSITAILALYLIFMKLKYK